MQTKALLLACLAAASTTATASTNDPSSDFFSSVSKTFITNSFAGTWNSGCIPSADGATAAQTSLAINADGSFEQTIQQFSDIHCGGEPVTQRSSGTLQLQGRNIDTAGKYFYAMTMTGSQSSARFYLDDSESLSIVADNRSSAFKKSK